MAEKQILSIRTDMAIESHNFWKGKSGEQGESPGVLYQREKLFGLDVTEIKILNPEGEEALGKARGTYFSLSLPQIFDRGSLDFTSAVKAVADLIKRFGTAQYESFLVAALGNPDISPDALGSLAAGSILVTRHLDRKTFPQFSSLALCRPGVLGTSGMESAEQVSKLCELSRAELVIVIDALAGADADKLCRCIQISDAGISPGSGVGNDRQELSQKTLGVPVISIGVPTVIDAGHFGGEAFKGMFVTPRNIDSLVRAGARLIGYGINMALHRGLSIGDIDALIG